MFDDDTPEYTPRVGDPVVVPGVHHVCRIARIHKTPVFYGELEVRGVRFAVNLSALQPYQEPNIA